MFLFARHRGRLSSLADASQLSVSKWLEHACRSGRVHVTDSPARWVMVHRLHHQHSEREEDPHSPLAGFFWGHMGWLLLENRFLSRLDSYERYARDILRDPFYLRFERGLLWLWAYVAHAVLFYLAGLAIGWYSTGTYLGGVQFGLSLLLYGVVFRTIYCWHITWGVNSISHIWGYRNFTTDENSRNNWFIASPPTARAGTTITTPIPAAVCMAVTAGGARRHLLDAAMSRCRRSRMGPGPTAGSANPA